MKKRPESFFENDSEQEQNLVASVLLKVQQLLGKKEYNFSHPFQFVYHTEDDNAPEQKTGHLEVCRVLDLNDKISAHLTKEGIGRKISINGPNNVPEMIKIKFHESQNGVGTIGEFYFLSDGHSWSLPTSSVESTDSIKVNQLSKLNSLSKIDHLLELALNNSNQV